MTTISSSWNANDVVYYSESGGQKWANQSLHIQLSNEDARLHELPVRVQVFVGSEMLNHELKQFEWRVVDTTNRTMDSDSRTDSKYTCIGNHKVEDPHYFFFDGMVIDVHMNRTITQEDSAYVIILVGREKIKSPPFLSEKSRESHRRRTETRKGTTIHAGIDQQQPSRKKRRVVTSPPTDEDESSSEEEEEDDSDSDDESDVETENKAIQCNIPWSTEDLRRMMRARQEEIPGEEEVASSPSDSPAPDKMEEEHSSGSTGDSEKSLSHMSPGRISILSSPPRSRASSFELFGSSLDNMAGIHMSPPIVSTNDSTKLMEMLVENQKQLITIVANSMAPST